MNIKTAKFSLCFLKQTFKVDVKEGCNIKSSRRGSRKGFTNPKMGETRICLSKKNLKGKEAFSDGSDTDENDIEQQKGNASHENVSEHMQISKLLRFAKFANQTGTVLALLALESLITRDNEKICLLKLSGVQLLINLLKCDDQRCKVPFLTIDLKPYIELSNAAWTKTPSKLYNHWGLTPSITPFKNRTSSKLMTKKRGSIMYKFGGNTSSSQQKSSRYRTASSIFIIKQDVHELHNLKLAATVLWRCCEQRTGLLFLLSCDIVDCLMNIMSLEIKELDLPVMGIINNCCLWQNFRDEAIAQDLIYHAIRCIREEHNKEIQILAAEIIGKCAEKDKNVREEIRSLSGLYAIIRMIEFGRKEKNSQLTTALFTFWMCLCDNKENCEWLSRQGYAKKIMDLIDTTNENEVVIYSFGILQEYMAASPKHCQHLLDNDITKVITNNLQHTNPEILVATNQALKIAAEHESLRQHLIENDVLRLTWSNLKSKQVEVVSTSANAIYSLIAEPMAIAELMRSFVGGFELLVKQLQSKEGKIISSACLVISRVALDYENQTILSDYGITHLIVQLCETKDREVQKALCKCIVSYGTSANFQLALQDSITYVGNWLESSDTSVKYNATHALYRLSGHEDNCLLMYKCGVVKHLINLIRSDDESLQEASAMCLKNIRKTVLAAT